jgi:AcrR family transcriptional regulator
MTRDPQPEAAPIGRRERRKLEVHTRIYLAAQALFDAQGFDETTVDEIAEAADVVPATFFNHFQNKQALLGLMAHDVVKALGDLTTRHLASDASSARRLRSFISAAADEIQPRRRVARLVLLEFIRDAGPDQPNAYLARIHEPFVALIEEGQRKGEFRDDYDSVFLAQMAVGLLNSAITRWLTDSDYPVERGLVEAAEFVLNVFQNKPAATEA